MNPVQTAIREHVDATYKEWLHGADRYETRAGERYRGTTAADLFRPVLEALGLHVAEDPRGGRVFVTDTGKQMTRDALGALIAGALAGHKDATLIASVGTATFWERLADFAPEWTSAVQRANDSTEPGHAKTSAEYARAHRARKRDAETASARAFVEAARPRLEGQRIMAGDLYAAAVRNLERRSGEPITDALDSEVFTVPGPRTFYRVADEMLGARYKAGGDRYYRVQVAQ